MGKKSRADKARDEQPRTLLEGGDSSSKAAGKKIVETPSEHNTGAVTARHVDTADIQAADDESPDMCANSPPGRDGI